jgi:perosamine synthetase
MKIANEYDLYLIADNAQHTGKHCGHITTYSFENSKHLSCGEGGIAITNSEELALRMRKLSNHGFRNSTAGEGRTKLNLDDFQNPYYERHSVVGWNYRMSEFSAAIVVAQLENIKKLVESRIYSAQQFINVINNTNCNWLIPQEYHLEHSYWTFTVKYVGKIPWADFRKSYINNEGDGAYGAWKVPYLEPAIQKRTFVKLNPYIYENVSYKQGLCPVAETIQVTLMQFKTNYWDLEIADKKAKSLEKTIRGI